MPPQASLEPQASVVPKPMSPTNSIYTELELPDDQEEVPGFIADLELEVINEHP